VRSCPISIGDIVEVTTERIAYGGEAVARYQGLVLFIPFAAPAEKLRVRITELKRNFARAAIEQIVSPSQSRRPAPCPHFGICGGCQIQHISYQAQLEVKSGFIRDSLERIGGIEWPREIVVRSAGEFGYRARAQIKLEPPNAAYSGLNTRRIGFNRAGSRSVCDVQTCPILLPELNSALADLRACIGDSNEDLREIEIAAGDSAISFEPALPNLPGGGVERVVAGAAYKFTPSTFFQANALLIDNLVTEAVKDLGGVTAIDLYAGAGLFAIQLAKRFEKVVAVESDRRAAEFARDNARANGATNVEFVMANAEAWMAGGALRRHRAGSAAIDLVLLDPPRGGAGPVVAALAHEAPSKVVYVSCDPVTLARDLKGLLGARYQIEDIIAFDLFPQTYHVETIAKLARTAESK